MPLRDLPAPDRELVRRCLVAITYGPFLDDFAFRTRIGIGRDGAMRLLDKWPAIDDGVDASDECLTLDNCLNEICHGLEVDRDLWSAWLDVDRDAVKSAYVRWARSRGWRARALS